MPDPSGETYASLTRENEVRVFDAERRGAGVVDGWPIKMVFEFTAACNLHCFMCGFEMTRDELRAGGRTKFTLPVEMFRTIAERAFPKISLVNPTVSGEPLVLPYWDELVDAVAHYDCKLELISNGMLVRGKRLEKMLPHLAALTISFDGATKATFEHVRTGANFEQVMENVTNFARLRRERGMRDQIEFNFNVTLLRENVHELPQIVEIAAANDVDLVTVCYMMVNSEAVRSSSPLNCPEATNRAVAEARRRARALGVEVRLPSPLPADAAEHIQVESYGADLTPPAMPPGPAEAESTETGPTETGPPGTARVATTPVPAATPPEAALPSVAVPEQASPEQASPEQTDTSGESSRLTAGIPPGWEGKYFCNMAWRQVFIGQEGEVMPCCAPTRPVFGNAYKEDFLEIWNGPAYRELREGLYSGNLTSYCQKCPFLQESGAVPYDTDAHMPGSPRAV